MQRGRKIAAILAADVADYSRLMGLDEPTTLVALKTRRRIFKELVKQHEGREFGSVGDSLMAQFPSAVNAVQCALAIQAAIAAVNEPLPADRRMALRIGINLGDVIEEKGSLFGDGVNVAARLQSLASPGGIVVAAAVHEQVRKKITAQFARGGRRHVKNVAEPIEIYEILPTEVRRGLLTRLGRSLADRPARLVVAVAIALALAASAFLAYELKFRSGSEGADALPAPSIAVLPFTNLSGDPNYEYLSDGLSEELLHRLANVPGLQVAARTSSAFFKDRRETVGNIGRTLGVAYLLEGSVRKSGDTLRVTAQLVDARNGYHVWSETFDRKFSDILRIQDEIALAVLKGVEVPLIDKARVAVLNHATSNPEALDLYLRARREDPRWELDANDRAIALYEQAIALNPKFAVAHVALANSLVARMQIAQLPPRNPGIARATSLVRTAIELDPNAAEAHALMARLLLMESDLAGAAVEVRLVEALEPSSEQTLFHLAQYYAFVGWPPDKGIEYAKRWLRIDPLNPWAECNVAIAQQHAHRYEDSLRTIDRVVQREPDYWVAHFVRAGVLVEMGRFDEALESARREIELHDSVETRGDLAIVLALKGEESEARRILRGIVKSQGVGYFRPVFHSAVAVALDDTEAALNALERGVSEGDGEVLQNLHFRLFTPLHDEPRFQNLVRRYGQERRLALLIERTRHLAPWPQTID